MKVPDLKYSILAITTVVLGCGWYYEHSRLEEELRQVNDKVAELKESEEKYVISSRMSDQLNDIAEEQREMLDQQLKEVTVLQEETQVLLQQSEADKKAAIFARTLADSAAMEAQKQRAIAEANRQEAIEAKNSADTLSYRALTSSLAATSLMKRETGEKELAAKLAYLAYKYTKRFNVDPYSNYVFSALYSPSKMNFATVDFLGHRMNKLVELDKDHLMVIGAAGEAAILSDFLHSANDHKHEITLSRVSRIPDHDYRDAIQGKDCPILLSYDGHLVEYRDSNPKELTDHKLPITECLAIWDYDNTRYAVIGKHDLCIVSKANLSGKKVENIEFENTVCAVGTWMGHKAFADVKGRIFNLQAGNLHLLQEVNLPSQPTTFAWNDTTNYGAIGCRDGSIYFQKGEKNNIVKGHNSIISGLFFDGNILYSGSFDKNLIRWDLDPSNSGLFVLSSHTSWVTSICFIKPNLLCSMQKDGRIRFMRPDVELLAQAVALNLTDNLTQEEWDVYVGKKIPYEKIIDTDK